MSMIWDRKESEMLNKKISDCVILQMVSLTELKQKQTGELKDQRGKFQKWILKKICINISNKVLMNSTKNY